MGKCVFQQGCDKGYSSLAIQHLDNYFFDQIQQIVVQKRVIDEQMSQEYANSQHCLNILTNLNR